MATLNFKSELVKDIEGTIDRLAVNNFNVNKVNREIDRIMETYQLPYNWLIQTLMQMISHR